MGLKPVGSAWKLILMIAICTFIIVLFGRYGGLKCDRNYGVVLAITLVTTYLLLDFIVNDTTFSDTTKTVWFDFITKYIFWCFNEDLPQYNK